MAFGDFIQAATAVDTSGTSTTIGGAGWTSNITAGNMIVVGDRKGALTTSDVTSDSTPATFDERISQTQTTDGHDLRIHDGINQAGGVKPTLTVTYGAAGSIRLVACEYEASANTAFDQSAGDQADATSTPNSGVTGTRTQATELQIGVGSAGGTPTFTAGSGFTKRSEVPATNSKIAIEDMVRTSVGTEAADFTLGSADNWACVTTTYYASAPAPGANAPTLRSRFPEHATRSRRGRGLKSWLTPQAWW